MVSRSPGWMWAFGMWFQDWSDATEVRKTRAIEASVSPVISGLVWVLLFGANGGFGPALDRAGLVGADGATHHGSFDLSYLRCLPNMTVMTPSDENECRQMLFTAFQMATPAAVRYPRGSGPGAAVKKDMTALPVGRGEIRRQGKKIALLSKKIAFLAFGSMLATALEAAEEFDATVANMRFVKPLDDALVAQLAGSHDLLVTIEENVVEGGAGSAVLESLQRQGIKVAVLLLGLPDRFVDHGDSALQLADCGLDRAGILTAIRAKLAE